MSKFKIGKCVLVDIDNFMRGNPLFLGEKGAVKYE